MSILVTGGSGFIGGNFVKYIIEDRPLQMDRGGQVINLDADTYAACNEYKKLDRYLKVPGNINDGELVRHTLKLLKPTAIVHFAAESHVDNSILSPWEFVLTNVMGTVVLLDAIRDIDKNITFLHVSTDEVYGSLGRNDPPFTEKTPYNPRSPYAASKAASDHFVSAYAATHGLRTLTTHCSNNYGPGQHPEKFIPTVIRKAMNNEEIPIYGSGENIRDWIHVNDHCEALVKVLEWGKIGATYNIGGNCQISNIELAKRILAIMGKPESLLSFVQDRKGHDFRYDIDGQYIKDNIGWTPRITFDEGLEKTVNWYMNNMEWVNTCLNKEHSE